MWTKMRGLAVVVILLGGGGEAWASNPCGIFARIEEVSVGPDADQPTWILIKGDFLVVLDSGRQLAPARGHMCFSHETLAGKDKEKCLIEWNDLKGLVAEKGKGKAFVAFGSASSKPFQSNPKIREIAEQARQNPFPHPVQHGLTKLRIPTSPEQADSGDKGNRNPVLVLQEFQARKDQESQTKKDGPSR